jgi:hypothetical protein
MMGGVECEGIDCRQNWIGIVSISEDNYADLYSISGIDHDIRFEAELLLRTCSEFDRRQGSRRHYAFLVQQPECSRRCGREEEHERPIYRLRIDRADHQPREPALFPTRRWPGGGAAA